MEGCIFCKIVQGGLPARIEYQDENVLAFHDINPEAPVHLLVIPRKHIACVSALDGTDAPLMGWMIHTAQRVAAMNGWKDYRLVMNNGPEAGQTVFHVHLHLLSGRKMHWPPG